MFQPSTQTEHQRDINGDSGYSDTWHSPYQQLRVRRKWETPGNAMNRPKTNTYPKHYDISDHGIIRGAISPKPWHPVFVSQADILILITCNKNKNRFQAIRVCPRSQSLPLRDWFFASRFSEHPDRPIDVQRFVPPENVYHEIHRRICKRHDFEMGDWKVFNATRNALYYEPRRLEEDKGLGEPVAFTLVLDFCFGRHGKWIDIIVREITCE